MSNPSNTGNMSSMSIANMMTVDMKTFREDMRLLLTRAAFGTPVMIYLGNNQFVTLNGWECENKIDEITTKDNQ